MIIKAQHVKIGRFSKNNPQQKMCYFTCLYKERKMFKISALSIYPKKLEQEGQSKPKVEERKEYR